MIKSLTKLQWFYITIFLLILLMFGLLFSQNICWNCDYKKNSSNNLFFKTLNSNNLIDQIKKVQIEFNAEKFTLAVDNDGKWLVLEKGNYPALGSKIKELIFGLADLKILESKTSKPENFMALQLEDIDINKHTTRITLLDANNQQIDSIYIGKREFIPSPNADYEAHIFVRRPEEIQTWLVAGKLAEGFAFKDFVKQPVFSVDLSTISEIKLIKPKQQKSFIKIERNLTTGESKLLDIPPKYKVKDQYIVDNIVEQFAYLNYDDVILDSIDAIKVLEGQLVLSTATNSIDSTNNPKSEDEIKKNVIDFELVYLNDNYYLKINDAVVLQNNNWLYKISDYACQSLLVNKKDLLTEVNNKNSK